MVFGSAMHPAQDLVGQNPANRVPFSRPPEASYYTPRIPKTAFYGNFHPFHKVMGPMAAIQTNVGNPRPGINRIESQRMASQAMPAVVAPPAQLPMPGQSVGPGPGGGEGMSGFGHGFGYAGFGSTGGVNGGGINGGVSPYRVMRSGMFPGVHANGGNVRHGVHNVGAQIRSQTPGAFPDANTPAGGWR